MFAEKQKLVADLEVYGPGGKIVHIESVQTQEVSEVDEKAEEEKVPEEKSSEE